MPAAMNHVRTGSFDWDQEQRIQAFCDRMRSVRAEVHLVTPDQWPQRLRELAEGRKLGNLLYAPQGPLANEIESAWSRGSSTELIGREQPVAEWKEELFYGVDAAVTSVRSGIAEVGSLILWPTSEEPRSFSLVPPVHFAVLQADRLHTSFAEAMAAEQWNRGMPTNALLISGPSKSADIEQTLAYGVHGPTELIVLLVR
jgi:L-lactate dehydrogenase complex protein LldG